MPNPYFDDGDSTEEEYPTSAGIDSSPETSGSVELPEWALITSDLTENQNEEQDSSVIPAQGEPQGFFPVETPVERPKIKRPVMPVKPTHPSVIPATAPERQLPPSETQIPEPEPSSSLALSEELPNMEKQEEDIPKLLPRDLPEPTVSPRSRFEEEETYDIPRSQLRGKNRKDYSPQEDEEELLAQRMRAIEEEEEEETIPVRKREKTKPVKKPSRWRKNKQGREQREDPVPQKSSEDNNIKSKGAWSGGRKKVLTLRILIFSVLGVVFALGVKQIIAPTNVDVVSVTEQVRVAIGGSEFPTETGQSVAEFFLTEYFTLDPANRAERERRLTGIMGVGDERILQLAGVDSQKIVSGPFLVDEPLVGQKRATYTFALQLETTAVGETVPSTPYWLYISVPMILAGDKTVLVGGAPGIIPPPVASVAESETIFVNGVDGAASLSFQQEAELFFTAWAASDDVALSRYLNAESTDITREGLEGAVTLESIVDVSVEAFPTVEEGVEVSPYRQAVVTLVWNTNGLGMVQQYRMLIAQGTDNRWYVQDILGGGYQ